MKDTLLVENKMFLEMIKSKEDIGGFVSIIEFLRTRAYKVSLSMDDSIQDIFSQIHKSRYNDDVRIISKFLEKDFEYLEIGEHNEYATIINELLDTESTTIKHILGSDGYFDYKSKLIGYRFDLREGVRNISNLEELKRIFLILCMEKDTIEEFVNEIKIILDSIIFDEDIEASIKDLNDDFAKRKNEIIYHLYVIYTEIPVILASGISDYKGIGQALSIDCSPESSRATVNNKLIKVMDNYEINCELHTKMKRLSSRAPDRIYFSPKLPKEVGEEKEGKIFVYKITKHA